MRNNRNVISLVLTGIVVTLSACRGDTTPPILTEIESQTEAVSETVNIAEDKVSSSFTLSYYHDSEIENCADGVLLFDKKKTFDTNIAKVKVFWGDDHKAFEDYNPLQEYDNLKGSSYDYTFQNNALIPLDATKLWVNSYDENGTLVDSGSISVAPYKAKKELQYEFQVISDQQISDFSAFYRRSKNTFADIKENSPESLLIAVNGDIVDEAKASYYDSFYRSYNEVYSELDSTKLLVGIGNHEFILQNEEGSYQGVSEQELYSRYEERLALWKEKTKNENQYFAVEKEGSYFIFLGTTKIPKTLAGNTRADCTLGEEQLAWLQEVLEKASKNNKPIYLFSHGSLRDTVSGSLTEKGQTWFGYSKEEETRLREIISPYPQILFFSSHSHWCFESERSYLIEDGKPSFFNTAAIGYLWQGNNGGESYRKGDYEHGGAQGLYVEVYEDQLFIRGRQFEASDAKSKYWYSGYQVVLPIN